MKIDAATLRKLVALNLPGDGLNGVLAILAELQGADDARLEHQRQRSARSRIKKRVANVTVTGAERVQQCDNPPQTPLKEERKNPEANASGDAGPTRAELEKELFRRGRQVCGKASGGLIASLLKSRQHDVSLARSVLELAATKHDPREYVAAALKGKPNGNGSEIAGAFAELRLELDGAGGEVAGDPAMRDITPAGARRG